MKYTTIIDIAQALGISKSTVSRALRGDKQNVSKETRERILAMAKKMGYTRNELAVNLRKQSTRTIGIVVPEMLTPFYMNFITYAQQELNRQGYRVTLAQSHENPNAELANLQMFEDYRVEGILISVCHTEKNLATYQRIMKKGIPMVFFDRTLSSLPISKVKIDDYLKSFFLVYNPQIQISAESETKRSIFREKDKTKRSKKESAQHSKSRNKSFVMTSVSAL